MFVQHLADRARVRVAGGADIDRGDDVGLAAVDDNLGLINQPRTPVVSRGELCIRVCRAHQRRAQRWLLGQISWRRSGATLCSRRLGFRCRLVQREQILDELRRLRQPRSGQGSRAQRVAGCVGVAQRRVDEENITLHQPPLFAELDDLLEEELVDPGSKTTTGFGQHAVVGQGFVQLVTEEPAPGQVQAGLLTEATLAPNVEEIAEQPELE